MTKINTNCIIFILFSFFFNCCNSNDINYTDTSNVDYKKEFELKLLNKMYVENRYLKYLSLDISLNRKIGSSLSENDSIKIKKFCDSVIFDSKYENECNMKIKIFNETTYTNQVYLLKKGLLLDDKIPFLNGFSFNMRKGKTVECYPSYRKFSK